jgi:hypothetical protein
MTIAAKSPKTVPIGPESIAEARTALKTLDMAEVRKELVQLVSNHAFEMVLRTIAEAEKGHYAAMKFLFEMTGLYPPSDVGEKEEESGLAKILLERLGIELEPEWQDSAEPLPISSSGSRHAVK